MKKQEGFTIIEIIIAIVIFAVIGIVLLFQRSDLISTYNDELRKITVNSIYYDLTEVYYKDHGYYPRNLQTSDLTAIDPEILTDPQGIEWDSLLSDYFYEGTDCSEDGHCKQFSISASMDKEAQYTRKSE